MGGGGVVGDPPSIDVPDVQVKPSLGRMAAVPPEWLGQTAELLVCSGRGSLMPGGTLAITAFLRLSQNGKNVTASTPM